MNLGYIKDILINNVGLFFRRYHYEHEYLHWCLENNRSPLISKKTRIWLKHNTINDIPDELVLVFIKAKNFKNIMSIADKWLKKEFSLKFIGPAVEDESFVRVSSISKKDNLIEVLFIV